MSYRHCDYPHHREPLNASTTRNKNSSLYEFDPACGTVKPVANRILVFQVNKTNMEKFSKEIYPFPILVLKMLESTVIK